MRMLMRGACIRLSRMIPVPLRLPHNYTPVFFNTLSAGSHVASDASRTYTPYWVIFHHWVME